MSAGAAARESAQAFGHEALLYDGDEQFLAGTVPFITAGVEAGEAVLVAVDSRKIALLRSELAAEARHVRFADMHEIGGNPACIIPVWKYFLDSRFAPGDHVRGIGEPVWPGRSEAELVECHQHEALLNLAFADAGAFTLLCPYDTAALDAEVIAGAHRSHPTIVAGGARHPSCDYCGPDAAAATLAEPLPETPAGAQTLEFRPEILAEVRMFVARRALEAGLATERAEDLVLAVNEVATNSLRHGGGSGTLRVWREPGALICDVRDHGRLDDPLAGRRQPGGAQVGGYGLWLANQVCDLVQLRSLTDGVAVRIHMHLP